MGERRITYDEWKGKLDFNNSSDIRRLVEVELGLTWGGWTRSGPKDDIIIHYLEDDRQIDQEAINDKLIPTLERGEDSTKRVGGFSALRTVGAATAAKAPKKRHWWSNISNWLKISHVAIWGYVFWDNWDFIHNYGKLLINWVKNVTT